MSDFEGNISEPSRRSNHQVVFEEECDNVTELASAMASFSTSDWEAKINCKFSAAFNMPPIIEQNSIPRYDISFCNTKNLRGEMSNLNLFIGSFNVSSEPCSVFDTDNPSFFKWEEVESVLE